MSIKRSRAHVAAAAVSAVAAGVANGTQKTYTLVGADAGNTMRVRVTATNADGSNSLQSAQTAPVAAATSTAAPKNTAPPTLPGTTKAGQQLRADPGSWSGTRPRSPISGNDATPT